MSVRIKLDNKEILLITTALSLYGISVLEARITEKEREKTLRDIDALEDRLEDILYSGECKHCTKRTCETLNKDGTAHCGQKN